MPVGAATGATVGAAQHAATQHRSGQQQQQQPVHGRGAKLLNYLVAIDDAGAAVERLRRMRRGEERARSHPQLI